MNATGLLRARFNLQRGAFTLDTELELPATGISALFGASGTGKTTLLRCLAGLEHSPNGFLEVDGECWQDDARQIFVPTHQRKIGFIFQDARLFPHLSVRRNLEYGYRRTQKALRRIGLDQVVELLGIDALLQRYPHQLSGGEQQRVAIGRALLTSPRLLLMDEPLAALDASRKDEILPYLEQLRDELALPIVYVSHHLEEVTRLADYLVLLDNGQVRASGPLQDLLSRLDLPLANIDEAGAVINAVVASHDEGFAISYLDFDGGRFSVVRQAYVAGQYVRVRIPARDVSLALEKPQHSSILNIFEATIVEIAEVNTAQAMIKLSVGNTCLLARITRKSSALLGLRVGMRVFAQIKGVALMKL